MPTPGMWVQDNHMLASTAVVAPGTRMLALTAVLAHDIHVTASVAVVVPGIHMLALGTVFQVGIE
jgi:hypothetical protein